MTDRNLNDLTESELNALIFKDAEMVEHRGLSDAFTDDEILDLPNHPDYDTFSTYFQDWIYDAIDSIIWKEEV